MGVETDFARIISPRFVDEHFQQPRRDPPPAELRHRVHVHDIPLAPGEILIRRRMLMIRQPAARDDLPIHHPYKRGKSLCPNRPGKLRQNRRPKIRVRRIRPRNFRQKFQP
jgi:hypothetical protein